MRTTTSHDGASNCAEFSGGARLRTRRSNAAGADEVVPLGPKAALMHERRKARSLSSRARPGSLADAGECITLISDDGSLTFLLQAHQAGLFVERIQSRSAGAVITAAMVFESHETFGRWCEADPVRFDHPMLHSRLRRQGDELLGRND
jgi:hypothetical protein